MTDQTNGILLPSPLYRDPIFDGPTDPTVIWNREESCWWMLYTQRRSSGVNFGVSSIHGTRIGVASSADGARWLYRGTLPGLDFEPGHNTFWAPEVIRANGKYHMYVSYITGRAARTGTGRRHIVHYTADNLWQWRFESVLPLSSGRVIDACVYEVAPGKWKLWYKDEAHTTAIPTPPKAATCIPGRLVVRRSQTAPMKAPTLVLNSAAKSG